MATAYGGSSAELMSARLLGLSVSGKLFLKCWLLSAPVPFMFGVVSLCKSPAFVIPLDDLRLQYIHVIMIFVLRILSLLDSAM